VTAGGAALMVGPAIVSGAARAAPPPLT
jgi:hypothetical protein